VELARLWARIEARRSLRPLLVLTLLVALATAVVLTSAAGARRGASAVDRLLAQTRPATAVVIPNHVGFDWDRVRASPTVEALTTFPAYTSLAIEEAADDEPLTSFVPLDAEAMRTVERPVVLAGRRLDPAAADEAVVTADFARHTGRGAGDTVTLRLMTPAEADASAGGAEVRTTGPRVRLRIVGVVRSAWYADEVGGYGSLIPSPALAVRYRPNLLGQRGQVLRNALVRLRHGERDLPAFRADLARISGRTDVDIVNRSEAVGHARTVAGFESACLAAFGLAALLAAFALVGQAVTRYAAGRASDLRALAVSGLTRRQAMALTALGPTGAALAGAVVGAAGAVAASGLLPFGVAATREPNPGTSVDLVVLGAGLVVVPLLVAVTAAAAVRLRLGGGRGERGASGASPGRVRPSAPGGLARALGRVGLPVPVALGAQLALAGGRGWEGGRSPGAGPDRARDAGRARPALFGAIVGMIGIVAAASFAAGVTDASRHKERFGQTYQFLVILGSDGHDFAPATAVLTALSRRPEVAGITDVRIGAGTSGRVSVITHTYQPVGDPVPLVLTAGVAPAAPADVVLAPATARQLHAGLGSTLRLAGDLGAMTVRVRGVGFGMQSSTNRYDEGAWILPASYDTLFAGYKEHGGMLALRPGVDPAAALPALSRTAAAAAGGQDVILARPFASVQEQEIRDIRVLPLALSAFLILLALAAVGHALALGARSRAHDIAVLRALGLTSRQARAMVHTQAGVFAAAALLVGVPLGLVLGRTLWRVAAGIMPLRYEPPTPRAVLLLVGPLAVLAVLALAAGPARRVARLRVAQALRRE